MNELSDLNEDTRRDFGVVADFSNWNGGVKTNEERFKKMVTKETVYDPTDGSVTNVSNFSNKNGTEGQQRLQQAQRDNVQRNAPADWQPTHQPSKEPRRPGDQVQSINPNLLLQIATSVLPKVNEINPQDINAICNNAISLAFEFLKVWNNKIQLA